MKKVHLLLILILLLNSVDNAQRRDGGKGQNIRQGSKITGKVIDIKDNLPLEYSNIVLLNAADSVQITGTIADANGEFILDRVRPGEYSVKISFIGYEPIYIEDIKIDRGTDVLDLELIKLTAVNYETESAIVIANKSPVEYHIDKKVINVSGQSTSISGTAVEVLENVPSVNVDIEGNVTLRGSGSFTLLIDGRPTILDPNDALQQIPASTIENIEIVTNPSAKFDPEGVSGIINIIMKKSEYVGISGIINSNVGLDDKYGIDVLGSYKTNGYSLYLGGDFRDSRYPGTRREERITYGSDLNTFLNSNSRDDRGRDGYNFNGGADFTFDKNNQLGLSFRYGNGTFSGNSEVNYRQFTDPVSTELLYENISLRERGGDRFSTGLNYKHIFSDKHEIIGDFSYRSRNGEEFTINEYYDETGSLSSGRKITEDGPSNNFQGKIDYSLPLGNSSKLDAGVQTQIGESTDITKSYLIDGLTQDYILQDEFSNTVDYSRNIHSIYSMFNSSVSDFGYQFGLRGEYTDRLISLAESGESSKIQRWDYFPTIHASYSFDQLVQLMASYTRRINRPRGYYLEPFLTWMDQNNVRQGNPDIEPEYINSFEIAYQTHIDEAIISFESYYRERKNKIERVRSLYQTNVTLTTAENVGTDYTLGGEFMVNTDVLKFWNLNLMGDFSNYKLEGTFQGEDFARENFNWSMRFNNTFMITTSTKFQMNGRYNGPRVSAQGEYEGNFSADVALRQDFWEKKMALTLQIRDIFQTSKREGTTIGQGFETYTYSQRETPIVMLNLSINLNNFKQKRDQNSGGGEDMGEENF